MGRTGYATALVIIGLASIAMAHSQNIQPPLARKIPHADTTHGQVRTDDYFWLRQKSNTEVIDYLNAENDYALRIMAHTEKLQAVLYDEMVGRIKETDETVPYPDGDYYYYSRTEKGKQYNEYCRKKGNLSSAEEVVLDVNALAEGQAYVGIGVLSVSPRQDRLAYSVDYNGSEKYTLIFRDLMTGKMYPEQIPDTYYSFEWANDNQTVFYITTDAANRPYRLYRHLLGSDPKQDILVYEETDERFFVSLAKSRSLRYLFMELNSQITSEVRVLEADNPLGSFRTIMPRRDGVEYTVEHREDSFVITTNLNAVNFRVLTMPIDRMGPDNWKELIPHREDVLIESVTAFKRYLVVREREKGLERIRVMDRVTGTEHDVQFDEPAYALFGSDNRVYDTPVFRYQYSSLVTPPKVIDYHMSDRTHRVMKQEEIKGFDPALYTSERLYAQASDGSMIPVSLVRKKTTPPGTETPLLLYAYGAYGISSEPSFKSNLVSLLDRGFIYAIAHVRGGQELGRRWYENGKLLHKMNTFTDFVVCAEHLIKNRYTSSARLVITGGSAGGLLMGVVTNQRPDLFHAVVTRVPFVDVINTMLDPSIPLTIIEYEEWGNPNRKEFYDYMLAYSPYDNVRATSYPHLLITAGLNDPRVPYWEPAKWTAKLRVTKTDHNVLLLKTNMGVGHGGASGRYDYLKDVAFDYAFMMDRLGLSF